MCALRAPRLAGNQPETPWLWTHRPMNRLSQQDRQAVDLCKGRKLLLVSTSPRSSSLDAAGHKTLHHPPKHVSGGARRWVVAWRNTDLFQDFLDDVRHGHVLEGKRRLPLIQHPVGVQVINPVRVTASAVHGKAACRMFHLPDGVDVLVGHRDVVHVAPHGLPEVLARVVQAPRREDEAPDERPAVLGPVGRPVAADAEDAVRLHRGQRLDLVEAEQLRQELGVVALEGQGLLHTHQSTVCKALQQVGLPLRRGPCDDPLDLVRVHTETPADQQPQAVAQGPDAVNGPLLAPEVLRRLDLRLVDHEVLRQCKRHGNQDADGLALGGLLHHGDPGAVAGVHLAREHGVGHLDAAARRRELDLQPLPLPEAAAVGPCDRNVVHAEGLASSARDLDLAEFRHGRRAPGAD
mmetsp:Transcript_88413/g.250585  ORF Transcript_88413/g.250585 Transcript_88413/m.250585 type:complete len:407 (+) Transcript_88413:162-1382(+)